MGQEQSRPSPQQGNNRSRRINWWEALKLGALTAGVATLQWVKFALLTIEDTSELERRRRQSRTGSREPAGENGLYAGLSPEARRALVNLIDYQLTPVLVDQWRLGLVKVLLDPDQGPVLPDEDPQLRQGILDSLKSFQDAQDQRPTFREGTMPSRWSGGRQDTGPVRPAERRQQQAGATRSTRRGGEVLSEHHPASSSASPSAPPMYPTVSHPSAPPLTADLAGPSTLEPELEDCGICMDAKVQVQVDGCGHQMCCECAKAICSLEGRAPQCPFCRGAMLGVRGIDL